MSGTVYTVASGKGGVGKTTTSVNLAVALWQEGNAVALVDADIGMANLAAVLNLDPDATLHDVLAGRASVEEALVEAQGGNLLVMPGDRDLRSFADADSSQLRAAVDELAERCDYVIVDTGAGLSYEDVLPLGMAHGVLLVTTPDPAAFGDTRKTMEVADLLGAPIRGLVVTRAVEDTDAPAIANEIGAELLGTIPEDPAVMASTVAGNPLESHAPDSAAAAAYRDLADALLAGDDAWLEAHPREPAPSIDAVEAAAEPDGLDAAPEPVADDEGGTNVEAGEAWAAANEDPVGAEETTDIGDLMVEPGEADEASERGTEPEAAAEESRGVSPSDPAMGAEDAAPGNDEADPDDADSEEEPSADAAPGPEPDESPSRAPPDAEQASSPGWPVDEDDAADEPHDATEDASPEDASDDGSPEDEADEPAREVPEADEVGGIEESDDGGDVGSDEAEESGDSMEDAGEDERAPAGDADEPDDGEAAEDPDGAEEDQDPTDGEGAADAAGPEDEEPAEGTESDAEEETRGGLRGWLGRLF